jgi:hypothetical protein
LGGIDDDASPRDLLIWRCPVRGIFLDIRDFDPRQEIAAMSHVLEDGVVWRRTTPTDQREVESWFEFFRDFHSKEDASRQAYAATMLVGQVPEEVSTEVWRRHSRQIQAFVVSATLMTRRASLQYQYLRFHAEPPHGVVAHSGGQENRTVILPGWPSPHQEALLRSQVDGIVRVFPFVTRVLLQPRDHSFMRAVGAYRAAIGQTRYVDGIPVLLCACLEALTATSTSEKVVRRVASNFVASSDGQQKLERLYLLRHWFAHGLEIAEMRDPEVRDRTLEEGLAVVKEVVRNALMDDAFFEAATVGLRAARAYLDSP